MNAKLPQQTIPAHCSKCQALLPAGETNPDWVRHVRINAGVSLREMAKRIGISAAYMCDIENGRRKCPDRVRDEIRQLWRK